MALGDKSPTSALYAWTATCLVGYSTWYFALEESSNMSTGYAVTTNALVDEATGSGLTRVDGKATLSVVTTSTTNDTARATVTFTAASTTTVHGWCVCSTASTATYDVHSWYCFAQAVPIESGDTLTCTADHQIEIGV
jgi:sarcosine oxidase gamma subunit